VTEVQQGKHCMNMITGKPSPRFSCEWTKWR